MKDLREASLGFYRVWHAAVGAKHGLLIALRDAPLAPATLAHEMGLDADALARWCEGAWALGLLTRDARGRYRLARAHVATLGEPTSTEYLGHQFEYLAAKSLTFGALDDLLQGDRPRVDLASVYALATRYDHVAGLAALPPLLGRAMDEGIDVLDLGAGAGGWTRAALARFPRSRFTAADLDTKALAGLDGARVLPARKVPRAAFDLVYLGEVLAAAREPAAVLRAAHAALRPGGHLVAMEGLRPPEGRAPRDWGERLVLAMGLDFATDGSRYLTQREALSHARAAGFRSAKAVDTGGSLFLITARKPQTPRRD